MTIPVDMPPTEQDLKFYIKDLERLLTRWVDYAPHTQLAADTKKTLQEGP